MQKVIIRKATIEDLSSVQELNNSLFEQFYTKNGFEGYILL